MQPAVVDRKQAAWWGKMTRVAVLAEFLIDDRGGEQTSEKQQDHF
jgi:hypothetical protein